MIGGQSAAFTEPTNGAPTDLMPHGSSRNLLQALAARTPNRSSCASEDALTAWNVQSRFCISGIVLMILIAAIYRTRVVRDTGLDAPSEF
jgi:hypothetical protein